MYRFLCTSAAVAAVFASGLSAQHLDTIEALGEALFFDENLSRNRSQSCATCHDPAQGFADGRRTAAGAFSLGDDGHSLGDRNAPSAAYAAFAPPFHRTEDGGWAGGMFWDGRAKGLAEQAGGPPLNPVEMGMPDKAAVAARLKEDPAYAEAFGTLFGAGVLDDPAAAYGAMAQAIAAFERTAVFAPFDSKYDRFLRGEAELSEQEELGRLLFFSEQFTNCNQCHQLKRSPLDPAETFTDYSYHNIGVPENARGRAENGVAPGTVDEGLLANPAVDDPAQRGKFKTPTLRNVAVTGPYMHNGVFQDLRTVVQFYNRYNSKAAGAQMNPETGQPWGKPQAEETLSVKELTHGPALDSRRVDALVAFLRTLTDQRYEHLLEE
ncbi:cytochrome-c peroxidase [Roseobacteraceae bacterium NS-SX3]